MPLTMILALYCSTAPTMLHFLILHVKQHVRLPTVLHQAVPPCM